MRRQRALQRQRRGAAMRAQLAGVSSATAQHARARKARHQLKLRPRQRLANTTVQRMGMGKEGRDQGLAGLRQLR